MLSCIIRPKLLSVLLVIIALAASNQATTAADADADAAQTTLIISFKDMAVAPAVRCADLATSTGGTVLDVYELAMIGCTMAFPTSHKLSRYLPTVYVFYSFYA